jgi:GTP-binding protein
LIKILDARFVVTAVEPKGYPGGGAPEIAFVGRSNVGKSSMINALAGRRKLVRVSRTPGRTRTLNFFDVDLEQGRVRRSVRLADLPGYGFARVSKTERAQWQKMIETYLDKRRELKVVVSIIDGEVGPTPEDEGMLGWLTERSPRVLVAATKIDRLNKARRKPRLSEISRKLEVPLDAVVPFSATEHLGVDEIWENLLGEVFAGSGQGAEPRP